MIRRFDPVAGRSGELFCFGIIQPQAIDYRTWHARLILFADYAAGKA
jgi:hypothetical protein